jgi:hypothetical protein
METKCFIFNFWIFRSEVRDGNSFCFSYIYNEYYIDGEMICRGNEYDEENE